MAAPLAAAGRSAPYLRSALVVAIGAAAAALRAEECATIAARASSDYVRQLRADGSAQPESYAFGKGGYWSGPIYDRTIDQLDFLDVARPLAVSLASQAYYPSQDPRTTQLLIMVYWGTTYATENASDSNAYNFAKSKAAQERDSIQTLLDAEQAAGGKARDGAATDAQVRAAKLINAQDQDAASAALGVMMAENRSRDEANARNAGMLGYDAELAALTSQQGGPIIDFERKALLAELEEYRYFVVLMAYDYQLVARKKQHKLLWEARLSIRQHDHAFDQQRPALRADGAVYYGKDSRGLVRAALPPGAVAVGGLRDLGVVPDPGPPPKPWGGPSRRRPAREDLSPGRGQWPPRAGSCGGKPHPGPATGSLRRPGSWR